MIITMLRKKSITLRMTAKVTVSLSTATSWRGTAVCKRQPGTMCDVGLRGVSRRASSTVSGLRGHAYGHQYLPGLHALVHRDGDVGDLAGDFDITSVFIFIASMVATLSPTATTRPSVTSIETTTPPSGATIGAGAGRGRRGWRGGRRRGSAGAGVAAGAAGWTDAAAVRGLRARRPGRDPRRSRRSCGRPR